jgi:hypothetical protein
MFLNEKADCVFTKFGYVFYQFDTVLSEWFNLFLDELINVVEVKNVGQINATFRLDCLEYFIMIPFSVEFSEPCSFFFLVLIKQLIETGKQSVFILVLLR